MEFRVPYRSKYSVYANFRWNFFFHIVPKFNCHSSSIHKSNVILSGGVCRAGFESEWAARLRAGSSIYQTLKRLQVHSEKNRKCKFPNYKPSARLNDMLWSPIDVSHNKKITDKSHQTWLFVSFSMRFNFTDNFLRILRSRRSKRIIHRSESGTAQEWLVIFYYVFIDSSFWA